MASWEKVALASTCGDLLCVMHTTCQAVRPQQGPTAITTHTPGSCSCATPEHPLPVQTTLVALLARLYDPNKGAILLDGVDLRELDSAWFRSQIGVVSQVGTCFCLGGPCAHGHGHVGGLTDLHGHHGSGTPTSFTCKKHLQLLRSRVQEPKLFGMSVAENIAYGSGDVPITQQDIERAAREANAHEFIMGLPQGYATVVTDK